MIGSDLNFRTYAPGDETAILELFRKSFGRDLGLEVWKWRFQDNPAGPGVIQLAWDGGVLAAHYAVTAVRMRVAGVDWLTGLSGTTMTHPDYRGQGLFPVLARRTYEEMDHAGMAAVWGFPNAMSHRGFVKDLSWKDIYELPTLRSRTITSLARFSGGIDVRRVDSFDERFDRLWDKVKDATVIQSRRDYRHLQWRYSSNPTEHYQILVANDSDSLLGYAVFKRYRDEIQIVDLLTEEDTGVGVRLVAGVAEAAQAEGATAIALWLGLTHPLHHDLERYGFGLGEPVTYFGALGLRPNPSIYDFRDWHLTMGDSDVF